MDNLEDISIESIGPLLSAITQDLLDSIFTESVKEYTPDYVIDFLDVPTETPEVICEENTIYKNGNCEPVPNDRCQTPDPNIATAGVQCGGRENGCKAGFEMFDPNTECRTCNDDYYWNGEQCSPISPRCFPIWKNNFYDGTRTEIPSNYQDPSVDLPPPETDFCQECRRINPDGSKSANIDNSYSTTDNCTSCAIGYYYDNVSDECIPCLNGGTPNVENNACDCINGWSGQNCSECPENNIIAEDQNTPPVRYCSVNDKDFYNCHPDDGLIVNGDVKYCSARCKDGYLPRYPSNNVLISDPDDLNDPYLYCRPNFTDLSYYQDIRNNNAFGDWVTNIFPQRQEDICSTGTIIDDVTLQRDDFSKMDEYFDILSNNLSPDQNIETARNQIRDQYITDPFLNQFCECAQDKGHDNSKLYPNCDIDLRCPSPDQDNVNPCNQDNGAKCISLETKDYREGDDLQFNHWGDLGQGSPLYNTINTSLEQATEETQNYFCLCEPGTCGPGCSKQSNHDDRGDYYPGIKGSKTTAGHDSVRKDPTDPTNDSLINPCECKDRYLNGPDGSCEIDLLNFCDFKDHFTSTINGNNLIGLCTYDQSANLDENNYQYQLECSREISSYLVTYQTDPEVLDNRVSGIYLRQRDSGTDYLILYVTLEPRSDNGRSNFLEISERIQQSGYIFLHTDEINDKTGARYEQLYPNFFKVDGITQHQNTDGSYASTAYLDLNIDDFQKDDGTTISYNFPWPQGSTGRVDKIGFTPEDTIVYYPVAELVNGDYTGGPNIIIPSSCDYCPNNHIFDKNSNRCRSCNSQSSGYTDLASRRVTNARNDGFSIADNQCDCNEGWNVNTHCSTCAEDYISQNGECAPCLNGGTHIPGFSETVEEDKCTCPANWSPSPYDSRVNQIYTSISNIEDEATKARSGGPLFGDTCETCPNDHYWSPQTETQNYDPVLYQRAPQCSKCYLFDYDFNTGGYAMSPEQNPSGFSFNTQDIQDIDGVNVNNTPYTTDGSSNTQVGQCDCPPGYEWSEPVCTRQPQPGRDGTIFECDYGCQLSPISGSRLYAHHTHCIPNPNMGYCKQKHCTCLIDGSPATQAEIAEDVDPVGTDCPEDGQNLCLQCGSDSDLYTGPTSTNLINYQDGSFDETNKTSDLRKSTNKIRYSNGECNTVQCHCKNGTAADTIAKGCITNDNYHKCDTCDSGHVQLNDTYWTYKAYLLKRSAGGATNLTNWGEIYDYNKQLNYNSCYPIQDFGGACTENSDCSGTLECTIDFSHTGQDLPTWMLYGAGHETDWGKCRYPSGESCETGDSSGDSGNHLCASGDCYDSWIDNDYCL